MRYLPHHDLFVLEETEAPAVLAGLRRLGYQWRQIGQGKRHDLYCPSGELCIGEVLDHRLYLDGSVRDDLFAVTSGRMESPNG